MGDGDGHLVESERDVLLFFLDRVRDAVVRASAGLAGKQQRLPRRALRDESARSDQASHRGRGALVRAGHADILRERIDGATGL